MGTPVYVSLDYEQYKRFERQFAKGTGPLESSHTTMDERYYHKAIQFELGDLKFEVTGPMVMAPRGQGATEIPGSDVDPDEEAAHDAWVSEQMTGIAQAGRVRAARRLIDTMLAEQEAG